jgi:hypothetical protein
VRIPIEVLHMAVTVGVVAWQSMSGSGPEWWSMSGLDDRAQSSSGMRSQKDVEAAEELEPNVTPNGWWESNSESLSGSASRSNSDSGSEDEQWSE